VKKEGGVVRIEGGVVKKCKSVVKTLKTVVKINCIMQNKIDCRTALMSGSHASTASTVGELHHKIDTSATAYTK
jgi:D-aminopeptidase